MVVKNWKNQLAFHSMLLPGVVLLLIFSVAPMFGIVMAFQDFVPAKGILGSSFVGLKYFKFMFALPDSRQIFANTLIIAIGKIIFNMIIAVLFAGPINQFLGVFGVKPILFLGSNTWFRPVIIATDVWKEFGYNSIIYLAALTGIDTGLYEAASIDGASRWKQTLHITLPSILPTIMLMCILNMSSILSAGFDQIYNLYNPLVYQTGDIIDTYVYRVGLVQRQYSLGTAVGLMKSAVSFILIVGFNTLADRFAKISVF